MLVKLTKAHSRLKVMHMIRETIAFLQMKYPALRRVGVLSTTGTYPMTLYAHPFEEAGYRAVVPTAKMQAEVVHPAIYHAE